MAEVRAAIRWGHQSSQVPAQQRAHVILLHSSGRKTFLRQQGSRGMNRTAQRSKQPASSRGSGDRSDFGYIAAAASPGGKTRFSVDAVERRGSARRLLRKKAR